MIVDHIRRDSGILGPRSWKTGPERHHLPLASHGPEASYRNTPKSLTGVPPLLFLVAVKPAALQPALLVRFSYSPADSRSVGRAPSGTRTLNIQVP
jgi:hypothetical protein